MSVNKVEINSKTVLDLTMDTVTANDLTFNKKAHNSAGLSITGKNPIGYNGSKLLVVDTSKVDEGINITYPGYPTKTLLVGSIEGNWVNTSLPTSGNWQSVAYGAGRFVSLHPGTSIFIYSEDDGVTWKNKTLPVSGQWILVKYFGGKFISFNRTNGSDIGIYSLDGINWVQFSLPEISSYSYWNDIAYGNGIYIAVTYTSTGNSIIARSTDGINWTSHIAPVTTGGRITFGNGKFVATGTRGELFYSEDGINWTLESQTMTIAALEFGSGVFIAPFSDTYGSNKFAYSEDGIDWTQGTFPSLARWYNVHYGNGRFIITVSGSSNTALQSSDGINWNVISMPGNYSWSALAYGKSNFVTLAYSKNIGAYKNSESGLILT